MSGVRVGRLLGVESLEPGTALIEVWGFSSPAFKLLCLHALFHLHRLPNWGVTEAHLTYLTAAVGSRLFPHWTNGGLGSSRGGGSSMLSFVSPAPDGLWQAPLAHITSEYRTVWGNRPAVH